MRYLSLFSGIEAATVAWEPLEWEPVAFCEIEAFPSAVLAHHYPDTPNLGDITLVTEEHIKALGPIDLVVGGSPCQDLSVAGKRAGLVGERSGLFHHQMRIFHAARSFCGARYCLWENVPGAFSSNGGLDFAVVVGAMAGCDFGVPRNGWRGSGAAVGENGLVEWRVLDAQYVRVDGYPGAVPQRRERVFALLDTGDWRSRPPILFERESLSGNPAPRREAGEGATHGVAPCIGASGRGFERAGETRGQDPVVAHSLKAEGFDASEDGMGRGTPLVPTVAPTMDKRAGRSGETTFATSGGLVPTVSPALKARDYKGPSSDGDGDGAPILPVAFDARQSDVLMYGDKTGPLDTDGCIQAVAFAQNQRDEVRTMDAAGALAAEPGMKQQTYVMMERGREGGQNLEYRADGTANTILTPNGGRGGMGVGAVAQGYAVRRLTPRECERLQGFPDDYTLIEYRGKPAKDGPRYKALGNSMATNCMRWLGRRIQMVEDVT